jgi:hypothetical protein
MQVQQSQTRVQDDLILRQNPIREVKLSAYTRFDREIVDATGREEPS